MSDFEFENETLLRLSIAIKSVPGFENTTRPTLHRWVHRGVLRNGERVKLGAKKIGGLWMTSVEALRLFMTALTDAKPDTVPAPRSPAATRRAGEAAGRDLVAIGV